MLTRDQRDFIGHAVGYGRSAKGRRVRKYGSLTRSTMGISPEDLQTAEIAQQLLGLGYVMLAQEPSGWCPLRIWRVTEAGWVAWRDSALHLYE